MVGVSWRASASSSAAGSGATLESVRGVLSGFWRTAKYLKAAVALPIQDKRAIGKSEYDFAGTRPAVVDGGSAAQFSRAGRLSCSGSSPGEANGGAGFDGVTPAGMTAGAA